MKKKLFTQPPIFPVDPGIIPDARRIRLKNNIPAFLIEAGTENISRIEFTFTAGSVKENIPLLASTTNMMLTEGTKNYTAAKLNRTLDFYGSFYNLFSEKDRAGIVIYCMNKHLEKILGLASEILFHPVFPPDELKTLMKKRLSWYLINREKVNSLAMDQFFESIFGSSHPYGRKVIADYFNKIDNAALKDFHSGFYRPETLAIIVAGNIHEKTVDLLDNYFGKVVSETIRPTAPGRIPERQKNRKVHIDKPGAVQTAIAIGSSTINKRHPDYPG
ncbi:MAG: zinc protease, partial [Bacteroidota bacterium]|nr:zinc protease [Bacteroidota bacterium]